MENPTCSFRTNRRDVVLVLIPAETLHVRYEAIDQSINLRNDTTVASACITPTPRNRVCRIRSHPPPGRA